ncbi:hypothetical protein ACNS7O_16735 (plasmid) [Haloferacaceae archaeon DSL9]
MANQCQYLEYRTSADGKQFDTARAYCTAVNQFVQPMRADICNYRYDLDPTRDCEYYDLGQSATDNHDGDASEK